MTAATVSRESFPATYRTMHEIELANGGDLVGTAYPGVPVDLTRFRVPSAWTVLLHAAEAGLARLYADDREDWVAFVIGEQHEGESLIERRGDLRPARKLLDDWSNGWPADQAPINVRIAAA